jgi:aconitate hydratase
MKTNPQKAPTVESTPEMVVKVYERMARNLNVVRRHLDRPLTLGEKVLLGHLDKPESQAMEPGKSYLLLRPDRVVFQDVLAQTGLLQFMQTRRERVAVPTTIHCDHLIQARVESRADLRASLEENAEVYDFLQSAAAKFGAGFWAPGAGIMHQVVLENYSFAGELIIGTDSHTPNAGGLGACAIGVGGADAVEVIAGLPWELLYPRRIGVYLTGELGGWTAPKDIILAVAGTLTVAGATNAIIEYIGPGARTLSATGKATITNMGAELGATTSMFPYDERIARYLRATGRGDLVPLADRYRHLLMPDPEIEADPERYYERVIELDLSILEPHVVGPHTPDRARPLSKLAAEVAGPANGFQNEIAAALIGSCTNSSYEDMSRAADVAEQAKALGIKAAVPLLVTPGSAQVRAAIERDGQMQSLKDIGAVILANACGPCIGQWHRESETLDAPNTIVTSYNRNFLGRNDGRPTTMNFIGSPELVTALALAGKLSFNPLTDTLADAGGKPCKLQPPKPAPDIPVQPFDRIGALYSAPPADGSSIPLKIDPQSERLQSLEPWPAWGGQDFLDLPVLVKSKGKTTTDQISPAGPWLRYRGHLDKFSDNLFMGVVNAFTGETGRGMNVLTEEKGQAFAKIARYYRSQGSQWIVIGDHNYGEGSSREHAALSPRLLACAAVIARSFARIHEANLKKQGLLALTFRDPTDYERIQELDRISLVGLADMAPAKPLECLVKHVDGTVERLLLNHAFSASQLDWFRAGSVLNALHRVSHPW